MIKYYILGFIGNENITKNSGGFIILSIFLFELVFTLIFILYDMAKIRKYLY